MPAASARWPLTATPLPGTPLTSAVSFVRLPLGVGPSPGAPGVPAAVRIHRRAAAGRGVEEQLDSLDQRVGVAAGLDRLAERDGDPVTAGEQPAAQALGPDPAGRHRVGGAGDLDRDDRQVVRGGQDRGAATDPSGHASARAGSLGKQQQVPAIVEQRVKMARALRRAAAGAFAAFDRHGVEDQRDKRRGQLVPVEVIGRRGDRRALAQLAGSAERITGVSMWLAWLATRITGPLSADSFSLPVACRAA